MLKVEFAFQHDSLIILPAVAFTVFTEQVQIKPIIALPVYA